VTAQPPTPEQPQSPMHAFVPAVTVLFVVIIVVALLVSRLTGSRSPVGLIGSVRAPTSSVPPDSNRMGVAQPLTEPISPTGDAAFDAGVTEVARFVEATRGHPFLDQVRVDLVDDSLFTVLLLADFESGISDIRTTEITLKALGMLPPDADLVSEVRRSLGAGVIGFYDPSSAQLVIRGTALTPFTRTTLAHELTHALDDQWFDLDRAALNTAGSEAQFGFQALVEGTATWVEQLWTDTRTPLERAAATTEAREFSRNMIAGGFSVSVVQIIESPYTLGSAFVESITSGDGAVAIDRAFESPPINSEQILHPEKYVERELPIEVAAPPSDGPPLTEETLGELDLTAMLSTSLAPAVARTAGEGWGGDRYVVWRGSSGSSCIRLDVIGDTPEDSREIADGLRSWSSAQPMSAQPGTSVEALAPGFTRLTSCR